MNALTTTHVHLSDVDTGEDLVTCDPPTNPDADLVVFVGGHSLAVHGTHDQLHQLAAAIRDAIKAGDDT